MYDKLHVMQWTLSKRLTRRACAGRGLGCIDGQFRVGGIPSPSAWLSDRWDCDRGDGGSRYRCQLRGDGLHKAAAGLRRQAAVIDGFSTSPLAPRFVHQASKFIHHHFVGYGQSPERLLGDTVDIPSTGQVQQLGESCPIVLHRS